MFTYAYMHAYADMTFTFQFLQHISIFKSVWPATFFKLKAYLVDARRKKSSIGGQPIKISQYNWGAATMSLVTHLRGVSGLILQHILLWCLSPSFGRYNHRFRKFSSTRRVPVVWMSGFTSGVTELQPSRTTPQCRILIWKSEYCLIWILAIWGSWVYLWSFWPYLKIKYCLIWTLNIALFENGIMPYLNHAVFFWGSFLYSIYTPYLKLEYCLIWTVMFFFEFVFDSIYTPYLKIEYCLIWTVMFFGNNFWKYLHALFETQIWPYLNPNVFKE